jgi:hypothetical protein
MKASNSKENLVFDFYTIRLLIGLIAFSLPWLVRIIVGHIPDSISWSYYTDARDYFVGLLFVIGSFLMSYKGNQPTLHQNDVGRFWKWAGGVWKGAVNFRIRERKREEDWVGWVGGIAAWVTALNSTSECLKCDPDTGSIIHYIGAIILFSTTVYFCLVAFSDQVKRKIKNDQKLLGIVGKDPKQLRLAFYQFCGWGIVVIMLGLLVVKSGLIAAISNIPNITFWAEAAALSLFGIAWMIASQFLPFFTAESDRQKLFFEQSASEK